MTEFKISTDGKPKKGMGEAGISIAGLVGDFDWKQYRNILILQLMRCNTEKDLLHFIEGMLASIGSPKELKEMRKALRIKAFKKSELEELKEKIDKKKQERKK